MDTFNTDKNKQINGRVENEQWELHVTRIQGNGY